MKRELDTTNTPSGNPPPKSAAVRRDTGQTAWPGNQSLGAVEAATVVSFVISRLGRYLSANLETKDLS